MRKKINYYKVLNLKQDVKEQEIKKAYLLLAQKYHPDKHRGNKLAEKKFKQINEAYQILKDSDRRYKLDVALSKSASSPSSSTKSQTQRTSSPNLKEIFILEEKKIDLNISFPVSIEDLCQHRSCSLNYLQPYSGIKRKETLSIQIPPSSYNRAKLLFKNKGGAQGRKFFGNLYVQIDLKSHPLFKITGQNIYLDLPIIFVDALLGKKLKIPTPYGEVLLQIPKKSKEGDVLKLAKMGLPKAKEIPQGDMFVKILVDHPKGEKIKIHNKIKMLPKKEIPDFLSRYKKIKGAYPRVNNYESLYTQLKQKEIC